MIAIQKRELRRRNGEVESGDLLLGACRPTPTKECSRVLIFYLGLGLPDDSLETILGCMFMRP